MINLVVGGATGKLGKVVCALADASEDIQVVGGTASKSGGNIGREIVPGVRASAPEELKKLLDDADVLYRHLEYAPFRGRYAAYHEAASRNGGGGSTGDKPNHGIRVGGSPSADHRNGKKEGAEIQRRSADV